MNQLTKVFEGQEIRVVGTPDKPLFHLKDVCDVLGLSNTSEVAKRVREKYKHQIPLGLAGRKPIFVSESGLYQVIMRADQSTTSLRFQDWVYEEVLPSIRKSGVFTVTPKTELELIQMTATEMIKTNERIDTLENKIDKQMTIDYAQQLSIEHAKKIRVERLWVELEGQTDMYDTKRKVYARIGNDLKRAFAVPSYRNILRKDFDEAMVFINGWRPALI